MINVALISIAFAAIGLLFNAYDLAIFYAVVAGVFGLLSVKW